MNFFGHFIKQPPIPDKDNNDIGSVYSEQFSISKQKGIKGFNDDVSQIQVGSQHINEDSINQIKRQHKLLSGRRQSDPKSQPYKSESKQFSVQFQNVQAFETQNKKKDSKNSKLSLQSKFGLNNQNTDKFVNLHRQYSMGGKNFPLKLNHPHENKTIHMKLMKQLTELKKLKDQMKMQVQEQKRKYRKLIQTTRIGMQIEIRKKISSIRSNNQLQKSGDTTSFEAAQFNKLRQRLKQTQDFLNQLKVQLQQTAQQNESLQQKLFDLEQKAVGIELQVEQKFQKRRKQLQKKIYQQLLKNNQISQSPHGYRSGAQNDIETFQTSMKNNQKQNQVVSSFVSQIQNLQAKCKSYQTMLLQADQFRRLKIDLEQKQRRIRQRQNDLQMRRQEIQRNSRENTKKSIEISTAQQTLNKKLNSLKQNLKVKEDQLQIWSQQLTFKSKLVDQRVQLSSPRSNSNTNTQNYNLTFQKPNENKNFNSFKQYTDHQQGIEEKLERLNLQRLQRAPSPRTSAQLQTFRNVQAEQQFYQDNTQKNRINSQNAFYDPRKHEQYEQYDMNDRKQFQLNHLERYQGKQSHIERLNSPRNQQFISGNYLHNNTSGSQSQNRLGSFKLKGQNDKKSPQFYKPSSNSSFRYESQYAGKPLSSPLSHPNGLKSIQTNQRRNSNVNPGNLSPHSNGSNNRQFVASSYTRLNSNRNNKDSDTRKYQDGTDRSTYSRSSKQHSQNYGSSKGKVTFQGCDMHKMKPKYQVGNLKSLGNKLQMLKSELKNEIDSIL